MTELQFKAPEQFQSAVNSGLEKLCQEQAARRIWAHDAPLWKSEADVQEKIRDRLGWLTVANTMQEKRSEIIDLVNQVRQAGYTYAVLLGMGGSSLCPEVLRQTFDTAPGYLNLIVLDTTDPDTILHAEQVIDLKETLFIVASKSGKTLETLSQFKYFYDKVSKVQSQNVGEHFIAITDPGTSLEQLAKEHKFRHIFSNPPDIGGRYSALSFFGLVPGALIGVDIEQLLGRAQTMMDDCGEKGTSGPQSNPGLELGAILGKLGTEGHNKITFVTSPMISSYGLWVEQLIAESTGKEGRGLLPVEGEKLGSPQDYGNDRLFVYLRLDGGDNAPLDSDIQTLQAEGQPVVRVDLHNRYDLGGQFFLWEFATAVAALFLDINPFDEPNVQESKDNTNRILAQYEKEGKLPEPSPVVTYGNVQVHGTEPQQGTQKPTQGWVSTESPVISVYGQKNNQTTLSGYLHTFLNQVKPGDYIAIMAYVQITEGTEAALQELRIDLRNTYKVATTVGYGPRFLHSTGQLHKGGANNGVFIQITAEDHQDTPIPGEPYTFGTLKAAQALGDMFSLASHQRRNISIHISGNIVQGLHLIDQAVQEKL